MVGPGPAIRALCRGVTLPMGAEMRRLAPARRAAAREAVDGRPKAGHDL